MAAGMLLWTLNCAGCRRIHIISQLHPSWQTGFPSDHASSSPGARSGRRRVINSIWPRLMIDSKDPEPTIPLPCPLSPPLFLILKRKLGLEPGGSPDIFSSSDSPFSLRVFVTRSFPAEHFRKKTTQRYFVLKVQHRFVRPKAATKRSGRPR